MKPLDAIIADIDTLRHAVEALRSDGVEILSAEVSTVSASPSIHVVDHPAVRRMPGRYTHDRVAGSEIHAVPYLGCQVVWLDPSPIPGHMATFDNRSTHHV